MRIILFYLILNFTFGAMAAEFGYLESSDTERREILKRIERVYSGKTDPDVLNERPLKYSGTDNSLVDPNVSLKFKKSHKSFTVFEELAQQKLTPKFSDEQCRWLKRLVPNFKCGGRAESKSRESIRGHDSVEDLAVTWMDRVEDNIEKLPASGESSMELWSDDYWKLAWGATSYRYGEDKYFHTYSEAVASYVQPDFWLKSLQQSNVSELSRQIENWSPSEKYDLITNNTEFGLTREQKEEGRSFEDEDGDVEGWMGICHGWAAAAIMAPKAIKSFEVWGPEGTRVKWFPHDVRAMTSLAWANGGYESNFIGARCDSKTPRTYSNGRMKDSDCFDDNPATFHLALANLIGVAKGSFVMDAAFDYQVWNQPIKAFQFTYFNPLKPHQQSVNWADVAIPYDEAFKARDKFQTPLTRGEKSPYSGSYDDRAISKIVGVIASVVYLGEVIPVHGDSVRNESFVRVSYTYDLELAQSGDGYKLIGGEWHTNAHPDFLWVPQRNSVAHSSFDMEAPVFNGDDQPSTGLTQMSRSASRQGYPLCSVISRLLKLSATEGEYRCQGF